MTIVLTGGSGFLGSHIAEQLSAAGRPVRALVRKSSDTRFLRTLKHVELCEAALDDERGLRDAVQDATAIVHSAAVVKARSADEFHQVNAGGTQNLLAAALDAGGALKRFVFVSSLTVTGPSDAAGRAVTIDTPERPLTRYARSKLAAERALLEHVDELPVTIIRPPAIYGPRDREFFAFFKAVNSRVLPFMGSPDGKLSMIYGPDAAAACIAAIDADVPSGSKYFIDDGAVYTAADLAQAIEQALARRALLRIPLPEKLLRTAASAVELYGRATDRAMMFTPDKCNELFEQWVCDSTGTSEALSWEPKVRFAEGARLTASWYRREGWL